MVHKQFVSYVPVYGACFTGYIHTVWTLSRVQYLWLEERLLVGGIDAANPGFYSESCRFESRSLNICNVQTQISKLIQIDFSSFIT